MTCPNHSGDAAPGRVEGMIFSIQRFSLQDGPGIRTTVFLKGCPLRCLWCSNPESQRSEPELLFRIRNCQACGTCARVCPAGAVVFEDGAPRLDRDRCDLCLECVKACPGQALEVSGRRMGLDEVVDEACRDEPFYNNSGGGVTLSGGEPLFQPEFTLGFMRQCRDRGIRTALDTCGHAPGEFLARVLEHTDLVLFDLKHLDPEAHRRGTRLDNELVLRNLYHTLDSGRVRVWVRIPVIPGFNDSEAFFEKLARALKGRPVEKVSLLGYHEWGRTKYQALGREYPLDGTGALAKDRLEPLRAVLDAAGLPVTIDH
ncbi:MAG: glycyl-radical enzyme activating protein [Proteobacteria bacterium]|nr:glycyl-radical enzyme activating protein [Pseudomonadota bacterium]